MFCTNCGKQFAGNFCPACGTPSGGNADATAQEQFIRINITTARQNFLLAATVTVLLNGAEVAWVGEGQSVSVSAPSGNNTLQFRANLRKKTLTFVSTKDVDVTIKWNRITGALDAFCTGSDFRQI